ncbi:MAG: YihY/virulence factor BrkB family protein [Bacteroidota bacterium]
MRDLLKKFWTLLKGTVNCFSENKVLKLSAALSYYTIFSLPPLLMMIIGFCGIFYGQDAVEGQVVQLLKGFVGIDAAMGIQGALATVSLRQDTFFATMIGAASLLLGATAVFGEIQDSINSIWRLKTHPEKGIIKLLLTRLVSFAMIVVLGFLLLVSLLFNTVFDLFMERLSSRFDGFVVEALFYVNYVIIYIVITLLFAIVFKVLPDARIKWKQIRAGAMVTGVLFMLGKYGISFYLSQNSSVTAYGAAGSVIVLLLWVYYSSIILYFGAAFTQTLAVYNGERIEPNRYAVFVAMQEVEIGDNIKAEQKSTHASV